MLAGIRMGKGGQVYVYSDLRPRRSGFSLARTLFNYVPKCLKRDKKIEKHGGKLDRVTVDLIV